MKMALACLLASVLCASVAAGAAGRSRDEHPIEKVIGMLKDLSRQAESEGKEEAITYEKFEHWCRNSKKTLEAAIAEEKEEIETLETKISSKKEAEALLAEQIKDLEDELAKIELAAGEAKASREKANKLYEATEEELTSTIEAIQKAVDEMKSAATSVSSLQLVRKAFALGGSMATEDQRRELAAFLRGAEPDDEKTRPELKAEGDFENAANYRFKSDKVVDLLKELLVKFEDERRAVVKAETNSVKNYDIAKSAHDLATDKAEKTKDVKTTEKGDAKAAREEAEGRRDELKGELEADTEALAQTAKACTVKRSEWAERSEIREKEMEAMSVAVKILAKVAGVRAEQPENPVPPPSPVGLVQTRKVDPKQRAVQLLRASARETHSRTMERLAQEVSAHLTGPFDQVSNMIQKMIFRLKHEQKDEDDHKLWCDVEFNKTENSKAHKEAKIDELGIKLEEEEATMQTLTEEIKEANEMAKVIQEHMDECTEIRETGKAENAQAIKDAQEAQDAVAKAVAVLEAHYKDSGAIEKKSWEFVQRGVDLPESPSTWDSSYTGVADPKEQPGGIVTVLEEVSADFAKMEADTKASEESDQSIYDEEMSLSTNEKVKRLKEAEIKTQDRKRTVEKIAMLTASKKEYSQEHEVVEQYLKDLKHACDDPDGGYEDRKAARAKEVEALKEAKGILATAFEEAGEKEEKGSFLQRRRR